MIVGMPASSFPTSERDLSGCFVLAMARELARRGHTVEVVAPEPTFAAWTAPSPGVRVHWVPYVRPRALERTFHRAGAPENLARDPSAWLGALTYPLALDAALRARAPGWDAIVSHWGVPQGLLAARHAGARPHVAVFHSADVHVLRRLGPAGRLAAARIARGSDALVFVSEALRRTFAQLVPAEAHRSCVLPMGVDADPLPPRDVARQQLGCHRVTLLTLSRLVPIKGLDRLLDAVRDRDDVTLVVCGEGPERRRLEALAGPNVRFEGLVRGETRARWLSAADALVVPSRALPSGRSEGAPTAALEALSAGLPVIATRTGGLPELVTHEHDGLLVADDPGALRAAIARFAQSPSLRARLREGAGASPRPRTWPEVVDVLEPLLAPTTRR